jgi:soluble lytic murein transglycosylase-like protein
MKLDSSINDELLRKISDSIVFYADKHNIDSALAAALIARESRFNPNAVSPSAAKGLGQLIDSTASNMGVSDPFNIDQNLDGSFKYFRQMLDIWQGHDNQMVMALAGYLTGPRVVKDCNCVPDSSQPYITDIINYAETIRGGK